MGFFTLALTDGLSLEFEWQQVSSILRDSSQYILAALKNAIDPGTYRSFHIISVLFCRQPGQYSRQFC